MRLDPFLSCGDQDVDYQKVRDEINDQQLVDDRSQIFFLNCLFVRSFHFSVGIATENFKPHFRMLIDFTRNQTLMRTKKTKMHKEHW